MLREDIKAGVYVQHFKGNKYYIIDIAEHTETCESLVIYRAEYGSKKVYARPYDMFIGEVDKLKYPEVEQKYRFEVLTE